MSSSAAITPSPFTLGVNYWPRKKAMAMWKDFDITEIEEDFTIIKDLGMTLVRIFILWQDFQPKTPTEVDEKAILNLVSVAELAQKLGLKLDVTVPTLHMSGPNWIPNWLLISPSSASASPSSHFVSTEGSNPHRLQVAIRNPEFNNNQQKNNSNNRRVLLLDPKEASYRNPLHDELAIQAQLLLIEKVVSALTNFSCVGIWNLANELDLVSFARSREEGVQWAKRLSDQIRKFDTNKSKFNKKITCGLHTDSLRFSSNNLPVTGIFSKTDFAVMHAYPQYQSWLKEPLNSSFVPFSCVLTSVLLMTKNKKAKDDNDKNNKILFPQILMEEWGGCTSHPGAPSQTWTWKTKSLGGIEQNRSQFLASEEDFSKYVKEVLEKLHFCAATGALMWCFADYSSDIWQEPPCDESYHERYFGLVRPDGSLKPHALVLKDFSQKQLMVKTVDEDEKLYAMYLEIVESLKRNSKFDDSMNDEKTDDDWVKMNSINGSNEAVLEIVFRDFEKNILPKYYSCQ